jgi:hypothetical protein
MPTMDFCNFPTIDCLQILKPDTAFEAASGAFSLSSFNSIQATGDAGGL